MTEPLVRRVISSYTMKLRPYHCRAARGMLNISQADLAEAAGVSIRCIAGFESSEHEPIKATSEFAIRRALEARGIYFMPLGIGMSNDNG